MANVRYSGGMGILGKIREKLAYERESYRMSNEHVKRVMADRPSKEQKRKK